ncbi:MAG: DUF4126 domain-containing protein [Gammaproteobacteria bacterium]
MEIVYALLIGIGLAAASGFRVFLPLLGLALAARFGGVTPGEDFGWLLTDAALVALATATLLEIGAYYLPLLDHLLDAVTTPLAIVAGTLATAAMLGGIDDPLIKWGVALIAGGGAAGVVQAGSVAARAASLATTGGIGNPVVSTLEWIGALLVTVLAFIAPALVLAGLALLVVGLVRRARRRSA